MAGKHLEVPPKGKRSIINRKNKEHQTNCDPFTDSRTPWPCNAHHILPVSCFNPVKADKGKIRYIIRCILVSKWDINAGNRFKFSGRASNMVRLPLFSAYEKTYPALKNLKGPYKRPVPKPPKNQPAHNSRYSEHYPTYIDEVNDYLNNNIWSNLHEAKAKHGLKGKDILSELKKAVRHFRTQLEKRGKRKTGAGNKGTLACWRAQKTDDEWPLPFSMASTVDTQFKL